MMISFRSVLLISTIVRVLMILYGDWQDSHMEVRYTDVDYLVFSDAAALMSSGESPFKRTTYRYSPLLAFLLIPNAVLHRSWGKFLFSASDVWNVLGSNGAQLPLAVISVAMYLLVGYLIRTILKLRGIPDNLCTYSVMTWLFNPFTFTIGTRGNCEPLVCAVILWIITCIMRGKVYQAAIWYGLIVHFRIYPIIYAIPLVLVLDPQYFSSGQKPVLKKWTSHEGEHSQRLDVAEPRTLWAVLASMFSGTRILFGLISGVIFLGCTGMFYYLYGMEFLHEALLYHLTRTDPRHNFSIYFYHIYLNYEREFSIVEKLISFLPQFAVQLVLIFRFSLDLPFCFLAQTVAFVAFNKVITAQYFVWFFSLLPVIMPWSKMKMKWEGCFCILCWIGTQLHWLLWGYLLEFKGKNVFLQLWIASLLFLAANTYVLIAIIRHHVYSPIFQRLNVVSKGRLKIK